MPLQPARCLNCGSFISADAAQKIIICPYCRMQYTPEEVIKNFYAEKNEAVPHDDTPQDAISNDFKVIGGVLEEYNGESTIVNIPHNVKEISTRAFCGLSQITFVSLPEGLKTIQENAFRNCISLSAVYIPKSVKSIGKSAFEGCCFLNSINLPDNIEYIGEAAFKDCTSLSLIHVISGVKKISKSIFEGCSSLKSVKIDDCVKTIGKAAFKDCVSLKSIYLPEMVNLIDHDAFKGCTALSSIYLPNSLETIESGAFIGCVSLSQLRLPENLKNIGDSVFEDCCGLLSINIPERVRSIGRHVFMNCTRLNRIEYNPNLLHILDRDTAWTGVTCNPFEGSLMSVRFAEMQLCPRCGGEFTYILKEEKEEVSSQEAQSGISGLIKSAISKSNAIQSAIELYFNPDQPNRNVGYYKCSYFKCRSCHYKKYV